ncbi:hemolysin family protein [Catenovulum sp. 2E275]|uniref:hemolysin family protein n=1 Tax=Catenovulum sp. 2E275 TaxID=2980497 RepID=UPI0021CFA4EE|nr:hemolysin family protein [Catenovulum sp. 2E275]MCU4677685.1 hemolysin family protein [Catenovulum sp. 2E275]
MTDLAAILLLIVISAVFAMSEIAMAAARKIKLQVKADEGSLKAQSVLNLQEKPGAFFAMIQIALNAIAILGGIIGEAALTPYIAELVSYFYQGEYLENVSFVLSFICITALFILFADLLPKRIAMIMPESVAIIFVTPMRWVTIALSPFVAVFNSLTNLFLRICKLPSERVDIVTTEDIVATMEAGAEHGSLQQQEYQLIENVFELENRTLASVMTPRDQIIYFDLEEASEQVTQKIIDNPHNHFLVCSQNLDNLKGIVDCKDILRLVLKGEPATVNSDILDTDVFYLPETLSLSDALNAFKLASQPCAVVVNEYGVIVGLVTVKDLLSSFMAQLITPLDEELIIKRDNNSWLIDGLTPISDVAKVLSLDEFPDKNQYETIAGFILYKLKRLPKKTDYVIYAGYKFEVIDLQNVRIEQILVSPVK